MCEQLAHLHAIQARLASHIERNGSAAQRSAAQLHVTPNSQHQLRTRGIVDFRVVDTFGPIAMTRSCDVITAS